MLITSTFPYSACVNGVKHAEKRKSAFERVEKITFKVHDKTQSVGLPTVAVSTAIAPFHSQLQRESNLNGIRFYVCSNEHEVDNIC